MANTSSSKINVRRLTESAIMIVMSIVLSEIKILNLPFGGSITAFSMLPIIIVAYRYGTKWGLFTGFVSGLIQMLLGMNNLKYGATFMAVIAIILFDYLVAFGVYGLGGIFRGKFGGRQGLELAAGAVVTSLLRYVCHFLTGGIVWRIWAPEGMNPWFYSLTYNGSYMIPETIITAVGALLLCAYLDFTGDNIIRRSKTVVTERNTCAVTCKLASILVLIYGILYVVFDAVNCFLAEDMELVTETVLGMLGKASLAAIVLFALGELVQLLFDIRNKLPENKN